MSRTLFVSTFAPTLGSGRALRTYTCVKALAALGPVDVVFSSRDGAVSAPEYLAIPGLALHEVAESRGLGRAAVYYSERLRGTPARCCRGTGPRLMAAVERLVRSTSPTRVVAGDVHAATALMRLRPRVPFIYNAHNIEAERARGSELHHAAMLRYERRLLRRASESWMVSRADLATAERLFPGVRLRYVPNVVDVAAIQPVMRERRGTRLLMIGDFTYGPNRSARDYLIADILPRVRDEVPDVRLSLVGRGLDGWSSEDPSVDVTGFIPDIADAYADADCVLVPLTEGAGSPLKFVEALAYGMPIVATPLAAAGLEVDADVHYREGRDAAGFAAATVAVLRDGGEQLRVAARELAEREYSVESLVGQLTA